MKKQDLGKWGSTVGVYLTTDIFYGVTFTVGEDDKEEQNRVYDLTPFDLSSLSDYAKKSFYKALDKEAFKRDVQWEDWAEENIEMPEGVVARLIYSGMGGYDPIFAILDKESATSHTDFGSGNEEWGHTTFHRDDEAWKRIMDAVENSPFAELYKGTEPEWHLVQQWG